MEKENLELRMYGFAPYNVAEIAKGIQYGHAVVEYAQDHFNDELYQEWAKNHKTFIILNGGTSSTMEGIEKFLTDNKFVHAIFREPDLNNMLSGICFIVDERVFNKKKYPDLEEFLKTVDGYSESENYQDWINSVGGEQNVILREFLSNYKLA